MTDVAYGLLEDFQNVDERLRREQSRRFANPFEIVRLKRLKHRIRERLARLAPIAALVR